MWSRITNVIKPRPETPGADGIDETSPNVYTSAVHQRSNISVFREEDSGQQSPVEQPALVSRNEKRNMFKRLSKVPNNENVDSFSRNTFPKKVLSSLKGIASDTSLARGSTDDLTRQSQESHRPSIDSLDVPGTPVEGQAKGDRFNSIRSILKPNNTPGTGQNVRFFARDAFRVISPEQSSASEFDDPSLLERMQRSTSSRPSVQSVFATPPSTIEDIPPTPAVNSILQPIPPPNLGNIFDLSSEEPPTIPPGYAAPMLDSAVEISEGSEKSMSLDIIDERDDSEDFVHADAVNVSPTIKVPAKHDRSNSFSFGQNLLQSLAESSVPKQSPSSNRNRALSDTNIFSSMIRSSSSASEKRPVVETNDTSNDIVVYQPPERDPFAAHAMTYYTPGTMMPPSPPPSNHQRTASKEEDLIWSLRTQLTLQEEMCAQYESDLVARDEIIEVLNHRLSEAEKERKAIVRGWRKRVTELETCVRVLEDDVERSREESMDRSPMDEASSEALRMLQRRIGELEREKQERSSNEDNLRQELAFRTAELERVKEELRQRDLTNKLPWSEEESRNVTVTTKTPVYSDDEAERQSVVESLWDQERTELLHSNDALRDEQAELQSQLDSLRRTLAKKDEELSVLKAELEAQWKHAEKHTEDMDKLKREKAALSDEIESLREKLARAADASHDDEGQRADLEAELEEAWAGRDELGKERDELEQQLRAEIEQTDELTRALQEREDKVAQLEQECRFSMDSVKRLQENIRQRDAEIADHLRRIKEGEAQVDDAREGLTKQKREHNRIVDEQSRRISEVVAREVEARAAMEQLVKGKAEADVQMTALKDRVSALNLELERLRRQVHELQQESADKEVKLVQYSKQVTQLKDDRDQMNTAIEAKQQEIEMLKRQQGVPSKAGTAAAARPPGRRESSIFATPAIQRPSSVLSDASSTVTKERKNSDPASAARMSVTSRTVRPSASGSAVTTARRMDAPSTAVKVRPRSSLSPPSSSTAASRLSMSVSRPSSVAPTSTSQRRPSVSATRSPTAPSSPGSELEKESADATPIAKPKARRASLLVPA